MIRVWSSKFFALYGLKVGSLNGCLRGISILLWMRGLILLICRCQFGDMQKKLETVDSIALNNLITIIRSFPTSKAVVIRNFPKIKKQIKVHEINGGVKTGVCYKGKKCKCTTVGETTEPYSGLLRTAARSNNNLCTLKSCDLNDVDLNIFDVISFVNETTQEILHANSTSDEIMKARTSR